MSLQVSHGATSPALSERKKYPGFFRLAATDSSHNPARKAFIQHWGWDTVATVIEDEDAEAFSLVCTWYSTDSCCCPQNCRVSSNSQIHFSYIAVFVLVLSFKLLVVRLVSF